MLQLHDIVIDGEIEWQAKQNHKNIHTATSALFQYNNHNSDFHISDNR